MNSFPDFKSVFRKFLIGAAISFLLIAISAWLGYLCYEEYDPMFASLTSNKLSPGFNGVVSLYVIGHIGTTYIYSFLYHSFPNIEWISLANGSFLVIAGGMVWLIMGVVSTGNFVTKLLFLWLFNSLHLVLFSFTRGSFLLCGTSILLLALVYRVDTDTRRRWAYQILCAFIFLLGLLTRPEPALIILIFAGAFSLLFLDGLLKPIKVLFVPAALTITLFSAIFIDRAYSSDFYKLVEPDLEYQVRVQHNCVPLSTMKTAYDSVRYEAALGGLWSDPNHISVAFLRSLVNPNKDLNSQVNQWKEFFPLVQVIVMRNIILVVFSGLIALIFLWLNARFLSARLNILWAMVYVLFWALVFLQTYLSKINDRSFASLLSLYLIVQLTFYFVYLHDFLKSRERNLIVSVLSVFSIIQLYWTVQEGKMFNAERLQYQQQYAWVKKEARGNILLLNGSSYIPVMLSFTPFKPLDYSGFSNVYWFDLFYMSTVHPYKEYLQQQCNCDITDFSAFYRYLLKSDKDVYVFSTERRQKLLNRYLHIVHQLDCNWEQVPENERPTFDESKIYQSAGNLKLYKLKK